MAVGEALWIATGLRYVETVSVRVWTASTAHVIVGRRGKSLARRFPNEISNAGDGVEVASEPEPIVIRCAKPRYTTEELFAGKSPREWRAQYASVYDRDPDVGRETIED